VAGPASGEGAGDVEGWGQHVNDSVLYTIGTALNRARDHELPVQVLVGGAWLSGDVLAVDGHGVVLATADLEHAVLRIESVCAVRVLAPAPQARRPLTAAAHPMPAGPAARTGGCHAEV
jgi:hypothetical protein